MSANRCARHGQTEIGIISHEGREFAAFGASVHGPEVAAYTKLDGHDIILTTWCGRTMLACRYTIIRQHRDGSLVLFFRLTNNRFIAGYALSDNGMLFRGELLRDTTEEEARRVAVFTANMLIALDRGDEANFDPDA